MTYPLQRSTFGSIYSFVRDQAEKINSLGRRACHYTQGNKKWLIPAVPVVVGIWAMVTIEIGSIVATGRPEYFHSPPQDWVGKFLFGFGTEALIIGIGKVGEICLSTPIFFRSPPPANTVSV